MERHCRAGLVAGAYNARFQQAGAAMPLERCSENPIVTPGRWDWRGVAVFNPSVLLDDDGRFYMWERACAGLSPLQCSVGLLASDDGVHFEHVSDRAVLSPEDFDTPAGTVEDPRVVKLDGRYVMTFVHRPFAAVCRPNGRTVPDYAEHPDAPTDGSNAYRSGIAVSDDRASWQHLAFVTEPGIHDRDNILFPEKIGGRYVMLRRPEHWVGPEFGCDRPSMWLAYSENLTDWTEPVLFATPERPWEEKKIGGGPPPIRTEAGWLVLYHGVDRRSTYRVGAMLLDADEPTRVL
jgi:predicted GH43/DUF377 family glycosyl hydrolase